MPYSRSRTRAGARGRPAPAVSAHGAELPIHRWTLDDERLARLAEGGDERAFTIVYERYHQRLYRYCFSILRDAEDAYDALQSTLANALAALRRGQRDAPLRPWLFRIAHNETISLIRRRPSEHGPLDAVESCAPSAEARADERARLQLLVSDLQHLPERQRTVLLMRELSGLSHKDIATALGISVHTVGHAMLAARRSLGEFEEGRGMVCEAVQRTISNADGRIPPRARAHLRSCSACAEFAASIPELRAGLQALAPPLAPAAAAGLLAGLHGAASTHAAGGGGFMAAGLSGKVAGAALVAKAITGVAIVAVASAGVTGAIRLAHASNPAAGAGATRAQTAGAGHGRRPAHAGRAGGASAQSPGAGTSADAGAQSAPGTSDAGPGSSPGSGDSPLGAGAGAARKAGTASALSAAAQPRGEGSAARRHRGESPGARRSPVADAHAHSAGEPAGGRPHAGAGGQHGEPSETSHGAANAGSHGAASVGEHGAPSGPANPTGTAEPSGGSVGHGHESEAAPPGATKPAGAPQGSSDGERGGHGAAAEGSSAAAS